MGNKKLNHAICDKKKVRKFIFWFKLDSNPKLFIPFSDIKRVGCIEEVSWLSGTSLQVKYSRVRNKHSLTLTNLLTFFQGLRPYSGIHRAYFSNISIRYKWGNAYSFSQIFQGLRLFQTLEYPN